MISGRLTAPPTRSGASSTPPGTPPGDTAHHTARDAADDATDDAADDTADDTALDAALDAALGGHLGRAGRLRHLVRDLDRLHRLGRHDLRDLLRHPPASAWPRPAAEAAAEAAAAGAPR